jgi:anti-sigma28 factor (negative regulator of flagellin synthesis)
MLLAGGGVERVFGPHLQRIHRAAGPTERARAVASQDVVAISDLARLVQKARDVAAGLPDVRQDVVAEVSSRISAGYDVSSRQIVDGLLRRSAEW